MANYTLELIYPKAVGAVSTGLDADNRCYFAYPGLTYALQVCAIGGDYPYTYALSNAPAGMTIDADTGLITWVNPQTGTHADLVVTVTDTAAATDQETWTIVCGTAGWFFVDAVNGSDAAAGTLAAPWQTLAGVYDNLPPNGRCYFRQGTYTLANIPVVNADNINGEERVEWNNGTRGTIWIAYPGETPTIDFEYEGTGPPYNTGDSVPRIQFNSDAVYLDGFTTTRSMAVGFQFLRSNRRGVHVRRMTMSDHGPGIDGGNSAFLMWGQLYGGGGVPDTQGYGDVVYECTLSDVLVDATHLKLYSWWKGLIHGCAIANGSSREDIAVKADCTQFTIRACTLTDASIGGNQDSHNVGEETSGEICFNNLERAVTGSEGGALLIGVDKVDDIIGPHYVYRNTIRGLIRLEDVVTGDGPYVFHNNVIVNAEGAQSPWPFVTEATITDASRVQITTSATPTGTENLAGAAADGLVDANGLLTGAARTAYLGLMGHELAASAAEQPLVVGVGRAGGWL